MKLKGLSHKTDEYFVVIANDRVYYDKIERMLNQQVTYRRMMSDMEAICMSVRAERKVDANNTQPNRIGIYLHMAAQMDRLEDVSDTIMNYAKNHDYVREVIITRRSSNPVHSSVSERYDRLNQLKPEPQEVPMKFETNTVTYINGEDIEKSDKETLFGYIEKANERKEALAKLNVNSKAVGSEVGKLNTFIAQVVSIIDRRFG